ncbi:MAG TPA: hypothetical protein VGR67_00710 [Candidatus Polarisedimenticolia bacterium]|jgi:hypothetical protein|nr:hypothetical protein [Candidatus Polarisedimenticolia bacterium]
MEDHPTIDPGKAGGDAALGPLLGGEDRDSLVARALVMGVPAFMRRARALECLVEKLHASIAAEREKRLKWVFPCGREFGAGELRKRVRAFNRRWLRFLETVPLDEVRRAQEDYNRYYPIEREVALPGLPPAPFREIPLLERSDLRGLFPPLQE